MTDEAVGDTTTHRSGNEHKGLGIISGLNLLIIIGKNMSTLMFLKCL
jgi:hypothetical protein